MWSIADSSIALQLSFEDLIRNKNSHRFALARWANTPSVPKDYSIITQCPALVLPSRIRMPFFCKSARSRSIVLLTTDKTTDICCAEMNGFFLINSSIFCCLLVSCTSDKLLTELMTSLPTELPTWDNFINTVRSIVTRTPPQKFSTLCIGKAA